MATGKVLKKKRPKCYKELREPYRYKVMFGGRGGARSWTIADELLERGMQQKLLILCTRELQKSVKDSVYRLLVNTIERNGLSAHYPSDLRTKTSIVGTNGTEFIFMGIRYNADEIKSTEGIDIVWIEEGHALTEDGFNVIDPTIRKDSWVEQQKQGLEPTGLEHGSEVWISFNPRFKFDFVYQYFVVGPPPPNTLLINANYDDNPFFPQVLREQMEHAKATDYEKYLHVWRGEIKQIAEGAIFGPQVEDVRRENRLLYVPVEKSAEVWTFNDIGKNDPCAWWFYQNVGGQHRFIDYYEARFEDIAHYVKVINFMSRWYVFGQHVMPHDAAHDRLGMELNIKEQFEQGGVRPIEIVPRVKDKDIAIQLARNVIGRSFFHLGDDMGKEEDICEGFIPWLPKGWRTRSQRMEHGWDRLCHYRYNYNAETDTYTRTPKHDMASNAADALMQFAQSYAPPTQEFYDADLSEGPELV